LENKVETASISNLIKFLSKDEDVQQDLWVSYLSGASVESLEARAKRSEAKYVDDLELRIAIWDMINNPLPEKLSDLIEANFSDYEKTIICQLTLGFSASEISDAKGISEVRIKQSIATIRYNKAWASYRK
jgi:DNA-directed RNA polymerase specialized sigma24 family protein